ncbi:MAG TPA: hypothetical protein VEZ12_12465 [Herpetosiphonaceae bacterium]|nr:hypothetical protein [Herpetosiphonaceae bacterium]
MLLIGGPSGIGKTIVAEQIGLQLGISWLQVDDLRLALQYSHPTVRAGTGALHYFLRTPNVWDQPPERLRDGLIGVGEVMSPAIEIVVANHVGTAAPVVIEGDGILPSVVACPLVHEHVSAGSVAAVFLIESDERVLLDNMLLRSRGIADRRGSELRVEARAKWLFGQWLAGEAHRHGLPVLEARPWSSLAERILQASQARGSG